MAGAFVTRALAWASLACLVAGCSATAAPVPPAAPAAAAVVEINPPDASLPIVNPGPGAGKSGLPFRMPCAEDDVAECNKGCDDKVIEDCVSLAGIFLVGRLVPRDQDKAIAMYRGACDGGSARACLRMGDVVHAGLAPREIESDFYRRACDGGANLGCVAAAHAFLDGRGVGVDPELAAKLFDKSCQRGNHEGCLELARLYDAGEGVPKDPTRARALREKGCELGSDEACMATGSDTITPPR